jgi:hypothetical protein
MTDRQSDPIHEFLTWLGETIADADAEHLRNKRRMADAVRIALLHERLITLREVWNALPPALRTGQ